MGRLFKLILCSAALWQCLAAPPPNARNYILLVRRSGVVEFVDPTTLKTVSSITIRGARNSAGLNGIFSGPDGRTIYIEGPIQGNSIESKGCCWLYSIDLVTLQTKVVAGDWGTGSRRDLVNASPGQLQQVSVSDSEATNNEKGDRWQTSPDGRWWFGLRNGPALDLYDTNEKKIVRSFAAPASEMPAWASGAWLADRFYIYGRAPGSGRLWALSTDSTQLGSGLDVPEIGKSSGCASEGLVNLIAAGDRILLYEVFGSKIDRRANCANVPGGVWIVNPATGGVVSKTVSSLHFWNVAVNEDASEFYGVTSELPGTKAPAKLVRIDANTFNVLQQRMLESDYWWLTTASLAVVPPRDLSIRLLQAKCIEYPCSAPLTPQSIP